MITSLVSTTSFSQFYLSPCLNPSLFLRFCLRLPKLPSYMSVFSSSFFFLSIFLSLALSLSLSFCLSLSFFHPLVQSLALFSTSIPTINSVPSVVTLSSSLLYAPSIPPPLPRSLFPHTLLISANLKNYVPFFIPLPPLARSLRSAVRYFWTLFCCLCRL